MIILDVKPAKKHCFQIVFEDYSCLLLDKETVLKNGIKAGQNLAEEDIERLSYDSELTRATSKAMWLVSRRDYSKKEMISRLKRDGFNSDAVIETVDKLCETSVIDDERFAYNYSYNLKVNRKLGKRAIMTELLQKGIDREIAENVAEQFCDDDLETAVSIIETKYKGFLEDEKIKRRMYAALNRKGYSYNIIKTAIEEISMREEF